MFRSFPKGSIHHYRQTKKALYHLAYAKKHAIKLMKEHGVTLVVSDNVKATPGWTETHEKMLRNETEFDWDAHHHKFLEDQVDPEKWVSTYTHDQTANYLFETVKKLLVQVAETRTVLCITSAFVMFVGIPDNASGDIYAGPIYTPKKGTPEMTSKETLAMITLMDNYFQVLGPLSSKSLSKAKLNEPTESHTEYACQKADEILKAHPFPPKMDEDAFREWFLSVKDDLRAVVDGTIHPSVALTMYKFSEELHLDMLDAQDQLIKAFSSGAPKSKIVPQKPVPERKVNHQLLGFFRTKMLATPEFRDVVNFRPLPRFQKIRPTGGKRKIFGTELWGPNLVQGGDGYIRAEMCNWWDRGTKRAREFKGLHTDPVRFVYNIIKRWGRWDITGLELLQPEIASMPDYDAVMVDAMTSGLAQTSVTDVPQTPLPVYGNGHIPFATGLVGVNLMGALNDADEEMGEADMES